MPSLTELSTADLRDAGDAVETLIDLADYLPLGDTLLNRAGRLRDDIRERLGMPPLDRAKRGPESKMLATMTDADLDRLVEAVNTLLGPFKSHAEDEKMSGPLGVVLTALGFELVARSMMEEARAS